MNKTISYKRRGTEGILALGGIIDIFEATSLHTAACKAFQDKKANTVCVEMGEAERLDVTALQIVSALQRDVTAEGRQFVFRHVSESVTRQFALCGVPASGAAQV